MKGTLLSHAFLHQADSVDSGANYSAVEHSHLVMLITRSFHSADTTNEFSPSHPADHSGLHRINR